MLLFLFLICLVCLILALIQLSRQGQELQALQQATKAAPPLPEATEAPSEKDKPPVYNDIRDLYFTRLLCSQYYSTLEEVQEDGQAVGVAFPNPLFYVLVARIETWGALFQDTRKDRKDINFMLRNVLEHGFPGTTHAADINGTMVAVLNLSAMPESGLRGLVQDTRHSLEVLEAEFGLTVTVAFSRGYTSPLDLHQGFEDALRVLEYRKMLDEDHPITTYEELTYHNTAVPSSAYIELEQQLLTSIKNANLLETRMALYELISISFGIKEASIETIRFRLYGIVNLLLAISVNLWEIVGRDKLEEMHFGPRMTGASTFSEILAVLDDLLNILDTETAVHTPMPWLEAIPQYIEENYRDPNLNVSSVAEHFDLNVSYCSKMYKQHYGHRLYDRIQSCRLQAAKVLLQTDKSLDQIAEMVGFSNALTMSRAFKKTEGITPGRFREQSTHNT